MEIIQELNEKYSDITILAGIEMDILPDGTLDFPDEILSELDFVIAAIHSGFNQSEDMIMKRLEAACRNPYVDIIAHPTGRKIGTRDGYAVNMDKLIQMAKETNKILELNANPMRFDLKIDHLKQAQQSGVHIAINTDSHHKEKLDYMALGVQYARKAWIEKETVVNTWSIEQLLTFLKEK